MNGLVTVVEIRAMQLARETTPALGRPVPEESLAFLAGSRDRVGRLEASSKESNWTHAFFDLYAKEPLRRRQALAFAYALENEPVRLFPRERLVGQTYHHVPGAGTPDLVGAKDPRWREFSAIARFDLRQQAELPEIALLTGGPYRAGGTRPWIWSGGPTPAHIGWHWDWIVRDGLAGMFARVDRAERHADERGRAFLEGVRITLEALGTWADRHVQVLAARLEDAGSDDERTRLRELTGICRRVPRQGARTFHEAVQSFHLSYTATLFENPHGGNGPGRLDYYLWPYLERDLAAGRTTLEEARRLVDELFIRFHERIHRSDGHVETIVVAGTHPDGRSAANPLSRIMIESIAGLGITHPSVYIRMPDDLPDDVLDLAVQDVCEGGNRAQIVYDGAIVKALTRSGVPEPHARMYMCGGCMEIAPHGMNGDMLFCGFFNVLKVLELVLNGGTCLLTGERLLPNVERDLAAFGSFEDLYGAFAAELRRLLELTFRQLDMGSEAFAAWRPHFLISGQVEDCIARGRGINDGGARYEDFGSTPLAIPNVADCLFAVREAVFERGFVTADGLVEALRTDFAGREPLRQRLLALPKYGEGHDAADAMAQRVTETTCSIYEGWTNRLGGRMKPMIMSFMMAAPTGAVVGASPDGRPARAPIAQGVTPQSRGMRDGISSAMRSACSLPLEMFSGGASNIWDLAGNIATPEVVKALLKTFFTMGGQMFHGNVTDVEELCWAQEHPEEYPHMMVRVGGFSARFVGLARAVQDEIIRRHRHTA